MAEFFISNKDLEKASADYDLVSGETTYNPDEMGSLAPKTPKKRGIMSRVGGAITEPFQVAGEALTAPINALSKGYTGLTKTLPAFAGTLAAGRPMGEALEAGKEATNVNALHSPLGESATGKAMGTFIGKVPGAVERTTGIPSELTAGVLEAGGDIAALAGIKPMIGAAKMVPGAIKSTLQKPLVQKAATIIGDDLKKTGEAYDLKTSINPENAPKMIEKYTNKIAAPVDKEVPTPELRRKYFEKQVLASDELNQQLESGRVSVKREGESVKGAPKNLAESFELSEDALKSIYKEYNDMKINAGEKAATVPVSNALTVYEKLLSPSYAKVMDKYPGLRTKIEARVKQLSKDGEWTPEQTQMFIENQNKNLDMSKLHGEEFNQAAIDKLETAAFRKSLDDSITVSEGEGYQNLKNRYGAVAAHRDKLAKTLNKNRKSTKGTFLDAIAGIEGIMAFMKLDPTIASAAIATESVAWFRRFTRDPNNYVKGFYRVGRDQMKPREFYQEPMVQTMPKQPMTPDPSTGLQIPAHNQSNPRTPLNLQPPPAPAMGNPRTPVNKPPVSQAASRIISENQGGMNWNDLVVKLRTMGYTDEQIRPYIYENKALFGAE